MIYCPQCEGENCFITQADKLVAVCRDDGHQFQYLPDGLPSSKELILMTAFRCQNTAASPDYVKGLVCWPADEAKLAWPLTPAVRFQKLYNMAVAAGHPRPEDAHHEGPPTERPPYLQYDFSEAELARLYKPKPAPKPVSAADTATPKPAPKPAKPTKSKPKQEHA